MEESTVMPPSPLSGKDEASGPVSLLAATVTLHGKAEGKAGPVLYSVLVHHQAGGERPALLKRYSEFEALHQALLAARSSGGSSGLELACLPEKHLFGLGLWRQPEEAYAERARGLEAYLAQLLSEVTLVESSAEEAIAIADFLKLDLLDLASDFLAAASPSPTSLREKKVEELSHAPPSCSSPSSLLDDPPHPTTPLYHKGAPPPPADTSTRVVGGSRDGSRAHGVLQLVARIWSSLLWLTLLFVYVYLAVVMRTVSHVANLVGQRGKAWLLKWNREAHTALEVRAPPVAKALVALQALLATQAFHASASTSRSDSSRSDVADDAVATTPPRARGMPASAAGAAELLDARAAVVDIVVPIASCVHSAARSVLGGGAADRLAGVAAMLLAGSFASVFPKTVIEILSGLRGRSESPPSVSPLRGADGLADPRRSSHPRSPLSLRTVEPPAAPVASEAVSSEAVSLEAITSGVFCAAPTAEPTAEPTAARAVAAVPPTRSLEAALGEVEDTSSTGGPVASDSAASGPLSGPLRISGSGVGGPTKLSCIEMRHLCERGAEGERGVMGSGAGGGESGRGSTVSLSSTSGRSSPLHAHSSPVELKSS